MTDLLTNPVFTAFVSSIVGALVGAISVYLGKRRETEPSIQKAWTEATSALIEQYTEALTASRDRMTSMEAKLVDLTNEVEELNGHIDVLTQTLERHGIAPPPRRRRSTVDLQAGGTA